VTDHEHNWYGTVCLVCGIENIDAALATVPPATETATSTATVRKCRPHDWAVMRFEDATRDGFYCLRCGKPQDPIASRRSRNNGKRGRAAELTAARAVGGRKVGPLGHPWDVEMPGYARLQVRKYATPESMRAIAAELARIARAPGQEMPGYIWIEPGRGGQRLIVFRLADFADRHGVPDEGPVDA
jgi:hypothetical protein